MALTTGQMLQNRYQIAALLGQGGMGAVYRAHDLRLHIPVAVKEILPQPGLSADTQANLRDQFMQEAQVLARLRHPHLVSVTDYFEEAQCAYLVMTFVQGESLAARIRRLGALPESDVLAWSAQILDAIAYCHEQNVLHRDIKPENIIIQPDGHALLVDFGLVKLWDPSAPETRIGIRGMGTPEYAPPEQYLARAVHTDPRSDIYSLGATLYHALTGQAPPSASERIAYPLAFKLPHETGAHISPRTGAAIQQAMALVQNERWPSARDMAAALRPSTSPPGDERRPGRSTLWIAIAAVAALAILGMAALALVLPSLLPGADRGSPTADAVPAGASTGTTLESQPPATAAMTATATPTPEPTIAATAPAVTPTTGVPTATPSPEPTATPEPVLVHTTVSLQAVANAPWDEFAAPPQGNVTFLTIPFNLAPRIFKSQAEPAPNDAYPPAATLSLQIQQPQDVHLLLTAGNGYTRFRGSAIGQVQATCDGNVYTLTTLELGRNVREWHAEGDVVSTARETQQVWSGPIAGFPNLNGHVDMLTLALPEPCRTGTLTALTVRDSSVETAGSRDPALNLIALTVAHHQ
jgi:eukaryotic-like serine/threonine-protein kinase